MKYPESATRLRNLRERAGLTQTEVAKRIDVDQSAVSYWERGHNQPTRKNQKDLARLYDIPVDELLQKPQDRQEG